MSESRLRVGELCAGYGGPTSAIEWVMGAETAWLAEIDPPQAAYVLGDMLVCVPEGVAAA